MSLSQFLPEKIANGGHRARRSSRRKEDETSEINTPLDGVIEVDVWFGSDGACDMCFPGYSKTCMPTVRQIIDCLVAARPMPIRCGPCLTAKRTNTATNNRGSNGASRVSSTANSNNINSYINNNKNVHAYENIQSFSMRENVPIGCATSRD